MAYDNIGTGILCPFRRDGKGDFAVGSGLDLLRSDVAELLGLQCSTTTEPGELPWDMARGTTLGRLRHRRLHSEMTRALADQICSGALQQYEPRVRPGKVIVEADDDTLTVRVSYRPLGGDRAEQVVSLMV